jgi:transposase
MLWEVSVVEQRYEAVVEVIREGTSVVDIAARMGVSRQSVHTWLRRYRDGGLEALKDGSHRPASCPHQIDAAIEARVVELRRLHPGWGPRNLLHQLTRDGVADLPSLSALYRCLVRHRLIEPRKRRRKDDYVRWERGRPWSCGRWTS